MWPSKKWQSQLQGKTNQPTSQTGIVFNNKRRGAAAGRRGAGNAFQIISLTFYFYGNCLSFYIHLLLHNFFFFVFLVFLMLLICAARWIADQLMAGWDLLHFFGCSFAWPTYAESYRWAKYYFCGSKSHLALDYQRPSTQCALMNLFWLANVRRC